MTGLTRPRVASDQIVAQAVVVAARLLGDDLLTVRRGRPAQRARAYAVEAALLLYLDSDPAQLLHQAHSWTTTEEAAFVARCMAAPSWRPEVVLGVIAALRRSVRPTGAGMCASARPLGVRPMDNPSHLGRAP